MNNHNNDTQSGLQDIAHSITHKQDMNYEGSCLQVIFTIGIFIYLFIDRNIIYNAIEFIRNIIR